MKHYTTLTNPQTYQKALVYLDLLKAGEKAGEYLHHRLKNIDFDLVIIEPIWDLLAIA